MVKRSAELVQRNGLFLKAAIELNNVGFWLARSGELRMAEERLLQAIELQKKEPELSREASICDSLGHNYTLMGRLNDGERLLQRSAGIFECLSNNTELAATTIHLSKLHQKMRKYHIARDEAMRGLKLATESRLDLLRIEASDLVLSLESDINRYPENGRMKVQRARHFIDNNLHRDLALKELARVVNISPYRLAHLFKSEIGTSPVSYIRAARMHKGKERLENSCLSVKQIMLDLGVSDESHFSRDFKKRYGLSPIQYRARFLAEQQLAK